jgi:sugar-specific transcriptional regulator TrmB
MYEVELREFGLSDNEIKIYLVLLEHGSLNPSELAKKTGLHRSYVYDTVERLLERGIINTVLVNNKKHYQAVDPKVLREIFELKLRHLDALLPKLSGLFMSAKEETKVELHRGKYVYRTLLKDLLSDLRKEDIVYLLGVEEDVLEVTEPIYLKRYLDILREKKVKEKIIIAKGGKRLKAPNLEYRELDPKYVGDTTTVVHGSKVYLFIRGNPNYLILINSPEVANTYKRQFDLFWSAAI